MFTPRHADNTSPANPYAAFNMARHGHYPVGTDIVVTVNGRADHDGIITGRDGDLSTYVITSGEWAGIEHAFRPGAPFISLA